MVERLRAKWSTLREHLRGGTTSPRRFGQSVALGFFVGTLPLYGLQTILSAALGWMLGLDVLVVALASNISLPPFIPLILFLDLTVGVWIVRGHAAMIDLSEIRLSDLSELGLELGIGALVVSTVAAAFGYGLGYLIGRRFEKQRPRAPAAAALQT